MERFILCIKNAGSDSNQEERIVYEIYGNAPRPTPKPKPEPKPRKYKEYAEKGRARIDEGYQNTKENSFRFFEYLSKILTVGGSHGFLNQAGGKIQKGGVKQIKKKLNLSKIINKFNKWLIILLLIFSILIVHYYKKNQEILHKKYHLNQTQIKNQYKNQYEKNSEKKNFQNNNSNQSKIFGGRFI